MKIAVLLGVLLLSGCGSFVSLETLEQQALLTGNWSAVEEREKIIAKRNARRGAQCPTGMINFCEGSYGTQHCDCVSNSEVASFMADH